jgi:hypothetical protein
MKKMLSSSNLVFWFLLVLLGTFLMNSSQSQAAAWRDVPPFSLYDLAGQEIPFSVDDQMIVVLFLSPECFTCDRELFAAQHLQKNLQFQLIPICVGCDWREVKRILESLNLDLQVYMGTDDLKAIWGFWEFPTAYLVDQNMKIVEKWQGKITVESLEKEILNNALAKEKTKRKKADGSTSPSACSDGVCY